MGGSALVSVNYNEVLLGDGLNLGGAAPFSVSYQDESSGSLFSITGTTDASLNFTLDKSFTWNIAGVLTLDKTFLWSVDEPRWFWYRVEGKCESRECDPFGQQFDDDENETCPSSYIITVIARSISEVCEKIQTNYNFIPWGIDTIKKYNRPALNSDFEELPEDAPSRTCLELIDVTPDPNALPEGCNGLFIDNDVVVSIKAIVEITLATHDIAASGGLFISGAATVSVTNVNIPDLVLGGTALIASNIVSGSIALGGSAIVSISDFFIDTEFTWDVDADYDFEYVASGSLIFGGAVVVNDTFEVPFKATASVEDELAVFAVIEAPEYEPVVQDILVICCNNVIPNRFNLTLDDLERTNNLGSFLQRNGITIPRPLDLVYNRVNDSWQANLSYVGFSSTTPYEESYNIVFEFACISQSVIATIGNTVWKLAMKVRHVNFATGDDFVTRLVALYLGSSVCPANVISFTALIDTNTKVSNPETQQQLVLRDDDSLFESPSWIDDPLFRINISTNEPIEPLERVQVDSLFIPLP